MVGLLTGALGKTQRLRPCPASCRPDATGACRDFPRFAPPAFSPARNENRQPWKGRNGFANPTLLPKDEIQEVSVDMRAIAYRFGAGHRLRLDIASSSFPRLARNPNSGESSLAGTHPRVATNRVHYAPSSSYLELDVMDADAPAGR
jgi:predicted acyl esterase